MKLEPIRAELNALLKQQWQEWEIPREAGKEWPAQAGELLGQWWDFRRQRQREIDDSIARSADTETLYDQPYEDKKRVRVTGPFTVESLSPHRALYGRLPFAKDDAGVLEQIGCKFYIRPVVQADACWP